MGGWDVYCAFCGVDVPRPWWDEEAPETARTATESDEDLEYEYEYDPLLLKHVDAEWMTDTRLIGENAECTDLCKVFVTGKCEGRDYGSFDVDLGDDPRVPALDPGDTHHIYSAYNWYSEESILFPFHYACYDTVFRRMVERRSGSSIIDNQLLYEVLKSFCSVESPDSDQQSLHYLSKLVSLDYGKISECQEDHFVTRRGTESYIMFPGSAQTIADLYDTLPRSVRGDQLGSTWKMSGTPVSNVFTSLPVDIVLEIMTYLPLDALMHFRACSKAVYTINLSDGFWKRMFKLDMPWVCDMPEHVRERNLDWAASYRILHEAVRTTNQRRFLNLANRCRIWTICEPLVDDYLVRQNRKNQNLDCINQLVMRNVHCSFMPQLIWPQVRSSLSSLIPLMRDLAAEYEPSLAINVFWNDKGHLVGLGVDHLRPPGDPEPLETMIAGDNTTFVSKNSFTIDKKSWLIGMETTGRQRQPKAGSRADTSWSCVGIRLLFRDASKDVQFGQADGAKPLLAIQEDHLLLGLRVDWSKASGISRIGLLQVPLILGTWSHREFYTYHERMLDSENEVMHCLWNKELPAAGTKISPPISGSWMMNFRTDIEPMDALVFGISEEELSRISSFSADVRFGGFEVAIMVQMVKGSLVPL